MGEVWSESEMGGYCRSHCVRFNMCIVVSIRCCVVTDDLFPGSNSIPSVHANGPLSHITPTEQGNESLLTETYFPQKEPYRFAPRFSPHRYLCARHRLPSSTPPYPSNNDQPPQNLQVGRTRHRHDHHAGIDLRVALGNERENTLGGAS